MGRGWRQSTQQLAAAIVVLSTLALTLVPGYAQSDLLKAARDPDLLHRVIEKERPAFAPPSGVTGISVPHHLLAADLIARGFWAASERQYKRVILLSPDHFRAVAKPFGTTRAALPSIFGDVEPDLSSIDRLLRAGDLFQQLDTMQQEHGVLALAPFIKHFFPDAVVVPILGSVGASEADWQAAVRAILPLLDEDTLVVQSTDYSHYLPLSEAIVRDQESLATIAANDPKAIADLLQPSHLDSKASQFIQMSLQREFFGAQPVVLANRNSVEYGGDPGSTTSYVVTAYLADPGAASAMSYADQHRIFFAGDVLLGRYLKSALADARARDAIITYVRDLTGGSPMIVNLEGAMLDEPVTGLAKDAHLMHAGLALPILRQLNVVAAGLANNHADDLGAVGYEETLRILADAGVKPLVHGVSTDLGSFRIMPLNFVRGVRTEDRLIAADETGFVCELTDPPPLVAFVHWGSEYTGNPGPEQADIAERLSACGVALIVGAHSHQASADIRSLSGGATQWVFSLGNFIFDQASPRGSGALLEARFFEQGTFATRLVPMANLFDMSRSVLEDGD